MQTLILIIYCCLKAVYIVVLHFHVKLYTTRAKIIQTLDAPYTRDVLKTAGMSECTLRNCTACVLPQQPD